MKNNKIVIFILCAVMMLSAILASCSLSSENTTVTSAKSEGSSGNTTTTIVPPPNLETTVSWTHSLEEQEFYNSLKPEQRKVYDRVRDDRDFRFDEWQSYDDGIAKQRKIKMNGEEIVLDYCFTFTRQNQYHQNPDNINTETPRYLYIDKDKNSYLFDTQGDMREYFAYFSTSYYDKAEKNKISIDEALKKAALFSAEIFPQLNGIEFTESSSESNEYMFTYIKRLSDTFVEQCYVSVFYDGKVKDAFSSIYQDKQQISKDKEKQVLDRLDSFIKSHYGDKIKSYDYGENVYCSKINDDYVAGFTVVFTDTTDCNFVEIIVMKIE